ncbi:MAG: hypothetical protein HFJ65_01170 [Eggerthellaceae bacterium]|nr:hypothetical protein [Eggerthellaceae bacterium]
MNWMDACADAMDAKYCKGLEAHLENMGISTKVAQSAISNMVENDAVPTKNITAATPSMFPKVTAPTAHAFATEQPQTA